MIGEDWNKAKGTAECVDGVSGVHVKSSVEVGNTSPEGFMFEGGEVYQDFESAMEEVVDSEPDYVPMVIRCGRPWLPEEIAREAVARFEPGSFLEDHDEMTFGEWESKFPSLTPEERSAVARALVPWARRCTVWLWREADPPELVLTKEDWLEYGIVVDDEGAYIRFVVD